MVFVPDPEYQLRLRVGVNYINQYLWQINQKVVSLMICAESIYRL